MRITTCQEFIQHLEKLGISRGDKVVVHSRLLSFGKIEGGIDSIFSILQNALGPKGTLVVPTYIFDQDGKKFHDYDLANSPSRMMGDFSEYIRKLPESHRSKCPIHNHSAIGYDANIVDKAVGDVSFGEGSDFQFLNDSGFSLLLIGCSFAEGASYVHHVEALCQVPYRTLVNLPRRIKVGSRDFEKVICQYYSRNDEPYIENFNLVGDQMIKEGLLTTVPTHYGKSYYMKLSDLHNCVSKMIRKDPYAVVKKIRFVDIENDAIRVKQ